MEGMIRTFVAVELPDKFIPEIERIGSVLNLPGLKLVEPGLVHITLKFLGDIHENQVELITEALLHVNCAPFEAVVKGVGVFPKPAYIRVIWLGAGGDFEPLHSEVERVMAPFKFKKEHGFTPHATLARVKQVRDKAVLLGKLNELKDVNLGTFNVDSIQLKKSILTPEGPVYETLKEIRLK
ncbi:MAG: RNA 2',3'-cyclic phosphodiesterase [Candidatus Methanoperedens sp.]